MIMVISSCASSPNQEKKIQTNIKPPPKILVDSYQIGVDDQVKVNVWGKPELSVDMPVRPDGKITIPLIGDVVAAGKEPEKVAADIQSKLSTYVRNPSVTVMLSELRSNEFLSRIRVTGAVEKSISIPYRPGMTVLDAILEAGSITGFASPNRTKLHRKLNSVAQVFDVHLADIMEEGKLQTNLQLLPGDIITVPERLF
jgi:polysaccharide export outer membrane protein